MPKVRLKMKPAISIIIPVYNVSSYLRACISSALKQTLKDIEVILINDCSPDPLDEEICQEYALVDTRIKYISHPKNMGLGGARNSGLEAATGEYIWFIDSDDFIDTNACQFLYTLATKTAADIIPFSASSHVDGCLDLSKHSYYHYNRDIHILDQLITGKEFITQASLYNSFHVSACLHLFKRSLLTTYRFREHVIHEDTDLIPIIINNANSIFCVKYAPYYRLLRQGSTTQQAMTNDTLLAKHQAVQALLIHISKHGLAPQEALCAFTRRQYRDGLSLCEQLSAEKNIAKDAFITLFTKYNATLDYQDKPFANCDVRQLQKNNDNLRQELGRIKQSRLWRLRIILQQIKKACKL